MAEHADYILPATLPRPGRPLSIAGLVSVAADNLSDATDLPRPTSVTVYGTSQHIDMQFDPTPASYAAPAAWAELFGGTLTSRTWHNDAREPVNICRTQFEYHGIAVCAFAVIPAVTATL
jgi:hypothetical protein